MQEQKLKIRRRKYLGMYRGVVVDNDDPEQQGRIRVRVQPMMYDPLIPDKALPWAIPATSLAEAPGADFGVVSIPDMKSKVWVFFENGDFTQPVYWAGAPDGVTGQLTEAEDNYPDARVVKTRDGHIFYVDEDTISVTHQNGCKIMIDKDGNVTITGNNSISLDAPDASTQGNLRAGVGASGTFAAADGQVVTVMEGIVIDIE